MTRKKRVTRLVYGAFVLLVAAFVASSVAQVSGAVFFGNPDPRGPKVGPECAAAMTEHMAAIEAARRAASSETDPEAARARYRSERAATHPRLEPSCANDPSGPDALAALARLDMAAESLAARAATDLRPVRVAAQSFISGHTR